MTIRADAFRYGLLVGLKEAGLTEKVAYEILDGLEEAKYDLRGYEKTASRLGTLWNATKGLAKGMTGLGAKGTTAGVAAGKPTGRGFRSGLRAGQGLNQWAGKHPVVAGGIGAGGVMLGSRVLGGANASDSDLQELKAKNQQLTEYLQQRDNPEAKLQEMYAMAQMMRGGGGGGLPGWYNPRAIYG